MEKEWSFQQMALGQLNSHIQKKKNEVEPLSYTIGQKLLKMNQRAKII